MALLPHPGPRLTHRLAELAPHALSPQSTRRKQEADKHMRTCRHARSASQAHSLAGCHCGVDMLGRVADN
jgi:hypothetical protein